MSWYLYLARCKDGSLYAGITKDLRQRIHEHNSDNKLGAKSLRNKRPVVLVYYEVFTSQSEAAKREKSVKRWTRKYKLKLIENFKIRESK